VPFIHQEMIEILYHTLWETVHVFLEHHQLGHDVGASGFLYPFLGHEKQETGDLASQVAASISMKVQDDSRLRAQVAREQAEQISSAGLAIHERLLRGGKLILFGNGGSATDANDWAIDCVLPPSGYHSVPAISLPLEPANISAIANDAGTDGFHAQPVACPACGPSNRSAPTLASYMEMKRAFAKPLSCLMTVASSR
jgi:D-sedoheptulose 7-phosphate isomerase